MEQLRKPVHPGKVFCPAHAELAVFLEDVLVPFGITITDAAQMMNITRKALSEFINGKSSCGPQMALRIAHVTHTSADQLSSSGAG